MKITSAVFVTSVGIGSSPYQTDLPQIAVVGKSNVGKSSFINYLSGNGKLARTSKSPGRTRLINYFLLNNRFFLTDLPGYGYAEVNKQEKMNWAVLIEKYLAEETKLQHVLFLVDSRHLPTNDDLIMFDYLFRCGKSFTVIATKTDKLPKSKIRSHMQEISGTLKIGVDNVIPVSAAEKKGGENVLDRIEQVVAHAEEISCFAEEANDADD